MNEVYLCIAYVCLSTVMMYLTEMVQAKWLTNTCCTATPLICVYVW